jgi:hypothetical protein
MSISRVIAALHLLPSAHSRRPITYTQTQMIDHALLHMQLAYEGGVRAAYVQDVHDTPVAPAILPHTVQNVTAVGKALKQAFPDVHLGICLMQHGAKEPLQIANDVGADFVRIKVWIGAMMKAEGVITGCAYEGIQHRAEIGATHIRIFTDIYDRVGVPMHPLPLPEACRQAVTFCQSDGLVLTGMNVDDSVSMFDQIAPLNLGVPLILGGSATVQSAPRFPHAQHFIVHGAFIKKGQPPKNGLPVEWGSEEITNFMQSVIQD